MELWRPPNAATVICFPIVDADGDVVTGAASLDSEYMAWADGAAPTGGAMADLAGEATEIGSSGIYSLTVTAAELPTASPYVYIQVKTGTAGAKTQHLLINTATQYVDVQRWRGTQPLLLTAQRVDVTVGAMQANVVTASAIASAAIDADAIAADAIGASELATDAVAEIVDAVWDELTGDHVTANTQGQVMQRLQYATVYLNGSIALVQTDTDDIQTRLPAALVGGRMDASVGAMAANTLTASALATDAVNEVVDQVWDEVTGTHTTANTQGEVLSRLQYATVYLDAAVSTRLAPTTAGRTLDVDASGGCEVGTVATGAIVAGSFGSGAIDATAIAANAITSSELAQSAAQEVADEVLNRDIAGSASGGARIVRDALRALRNRTAIAAGTLTCYQEDDATAAWTATVTTTAGDPISQVDPA